MPLSPLYPKGMIQKRIVAEIFLNNGVATSDVLAENLDMKRNCLHGSCDELIHRGLIIKKVGWRGFSNPKGHSLPKKIVTYSLNTKEMYRINKILEEVKNANKDFSDRME
jgi:hypothetical protein